MECKNDRATECRCVGAGCPGPDSRTGIARTPGTIYRIETAALPTLSPRESAPFDVMGGARRTHQSAFRRRSAPRAQAECRQPRHGGGMASRGPKRYWSHPIEFGVDLSWAQRDQDSRAGRTRSRLLDARCGLGTETGADRLGQSRLIHLLFYAGDNLSFNLDLAFLFHETALL